MKINAIIIAIFLSALALITSSCQKNDKSAKEAQKGQLKVVASLFPVYDFAKHIGKEKAAVGLLLSPGIESHSFDPKPADMLMINESDMFIYTGRFMEPWAADILKGVDNNNLLVIDSSIGINLMKEEESDSHSHSNNVTMDPHVWLDLENAKKMVDNILDGFIKKDPSNIDFYLRNAESYKANLDALDQRFKSALSNCKKDVFIHGGHFAFSYLAKRYNLKYISAYKGFSPNSEPSPRHLAELIRKMKSRDINHVYYEELITPRLAETIAKETGATMLMLHGAHNIAKKEMEEGATFISLMENNLENLKKGLQCQ